MSTPADRIARLEKAAMILARKLWLFLRIVGRVDWSERRMSPFMAWEISGIIHPKAALQDKGKEAP